MGPDCGTAILDGVGLGFANVVERGPVGIVGASGTGIQEIACLLDARGIGISHAIGVGGRDLSVDVGGLMTLRALELLGHDSDTEVVVVVSKPPDPEVARRVRAVADTLGKPVVTCLLGLVGSLTAAAADAARAAGGANETAGDDGADRPPRARGPGTGVIAGLFSGGTLCEEARLVAAAAGAEYRFVDLGADELTEGRPHPMIDNRLRSERLREEGAVASVGAILLDVVLGRGAHPDPAAELGPQIAGAIERRGGDLAVVVGVTGARRDPQGLERQIEVLEQAGAVVRRGIGAATEAALAEVGL
jgi:FdrA protein